HAGGRGQAVPRATGPARRTRQRPSRLHTAGFLDRGGGSEEGAGEKLPPDQRRSRAAGEGQTGGARLAVRAVADRPPGRPYRSLCRLADGSGEPALRARGGQSSVAVALWRGIPPDAERFWQPAWPAGAPRAARLARGRIDAIPIRHEYDAPARHHL